MTGDARAGAAAPDDADLNAGVETYDELLDVLDALLVEAIQKVESGRVYDAENERVRIKWIRIAKDVVAEKRKVKEARDQVEIAERLERLEDLQGVDK